MLAAPSVQHSSKTILTLHSAFTVFPLKAGFFHDEIDFPEGGNDISDKTVWKAAIKRGQTRTCSQSAEHKQVRQCQAAYKQDYC